MSNSEIIFSGQTHAGDSNEETITGDSFKGDGFYGRSDGIHTVQYVVTGFAGVVVVQATLATAPTETDWFTVSTTQHTSLTSTSDESSVSVVKNFTGNYVWVRSHIHTWTNGTVNSILLNH